MVQVIDEALKTQKIKIKEQIKKPIVTYHDPCHLGRGSEPYVPEWEGEKRKVFNQITIFEPPKEYRRGTKGMYEEPRRILKRMGNSLDFIEMFRIAESAYCCGSGGGVKAAYPDMANQAVSERLEEADFVLKKAQIDFNEEREKIIVSACPFCKTNFEQGIEASSKNLTYKDINQLVLEMMEK